MTRTVYEAARQARIEVAGETVRDLLAKYDITERNRSRQLIRERFSQEDLDAYTLALDVLTGEGALG